MSWTYGVLTSCLLLLGLMLWKEGTRLNRARLLWRIVAAATAAASLCCMALPFTVQLPHAITGNNRTVLLTNGFNADSVNHFLRRSEQPASIYMLAGTAGHGASVQGIKTIPDDSIAALLASHVTTVFGHGFTSNQLPLLNNEKFSFQPSVLPAGIHSIHWNGRHTLGEKEAVQGSCFNPTSSPLKIGLSSFSVPLDSAFIPPRSTSDFSLTTVPRHTGKALYALNVLSRSDTLEQEPLPFQVDTPTAIRVLILSSAPDFENKFLKSWLAAHGYQVAVRTLITTKKYSSLLVNKGEEPARSVGPALLKKYDVVVCDPASLAALQPPELQAIAGSIADYGLGLLVRADSLLPRAFYASSFPLIQTADSTGRSMRVFTSDAVPDTALWQTGQPVYIRPQPGTQPLVLTRQSDILASSALYGYGKTVLTTIGNSYGWLLAGNEKMYSAYWSLLLKKAAGKLVQQEGWRFSPALPLANEAVTVCLELNGMPGPHHTISGISLPFQQNAVLPFQWQSTYWPAEGWQAAAGERGMHPWFVYNNNNWNSLRAKQRLAVTRNYLLSHPAAEKPVAVKSPLAPRPVPKIFFLIIFLLSTAYLWIEKKVSS